jgi:GT2 family glycosyltransferase
VDVCVVTYHNSADAVAAALRPSDRLLVRDNTHDNIGFAAGANAAAAMGSDPILCFVNPDGRLQDGALEALERALDDPTVVAAEASQGPHWDRQPDARGNLDWLAGACFVVRREAFERVGGFDERLFMYAEDIDLSYKLAKIGQLRFVPDAHFEHDHGTRSYKARHRFFRNWLVVEARHREAQPGRLVRDAVFAARNRRWGDAAARITGLADYALRARRWV